MLTSSNPSARAVLACAGRRQIQNEFGKQDGMRRSAGYHGRVHLGIFMGFSNDGAVQILHSVAHRLIGAGIPNLNNLHRNRHQNGPPTIQGHFKSDQLHIISCNNTKWVQLPPGGIQGDHAHALFHPQQLNGTQRQRHCSLRYQRAGQNRGSA